ncbi:monovalent cation/H+ antiporter subunit D [Chromohalobacter japonicus]|uniref:Monovalent cation/H+ antiporter subunit D n=1 Tax=Chromohalobacter japonicus TaxID=223900 RepID=A0A1Q8T9G5_9GAMM|nr:monovalent cation/H+ antiporter subunit D [Chromohalobacter japonicus]OLO10317.1 monovalent cation/H+ antiporter subunit D [Chromohalobacter japonicus]
MMQHLIILPVLLPLLTGVALLIHRGGALTLRRTANVLSTIALVVVGILLVAESTDDTIRYYAVGDWQPPFGIILVLDRLSALMVMLTSLLALGSLLYACAGDDEQGSNFHGLFQLQLMGINGAFLTGDLFNLFVFFEVLLIASYALLMHGGGKARTHAGFHYVALNLLGSMLFLIALGILYGTMGTLNMADMSAVVTTLDTADLGLVKAGALLLLIVFGLKAAMLPLYFWLPRAYAAAPAPIAALFAIMTKVGIYSIIRVYTLIFGEQAGPLANLAQPWIWWLGLATLALGAVGVLSARDMRTQVAYLILVSVGTLLAGIGMHSEAALGALLYYLTHTTLVSGGLFLLVDAIAQQRGKAGARIVQSRTLTQPATLGLLFFAGAIAMAGLPPLSGAFGKALLLQAATTAQQHWLWPILLGSGLASLIALSRTGSTIFWRASGEKTGITLGPLRVTGTLMLIGCAPLMVAFAGPITAFTQATAAQLLDRDAYVESIIARGDTGGDA